MPDWVVQLMMGGGAVAAVGALVKISVILSRIEADLRHVLNVVGDHEDRLRGLGV